MLQKRPHRIRRTDDQAAGQATHGRRGRSRFRRVGRWLLVCLTLSLTAVALAPQLARWPIVQARLLDLAAAGLPGSIRVGRLRLGWFRSIQIEQLQVFDDDAHPLASIQRVTTDTPLWRLVTSPNRWGVIRLEQAEVWLGIRPGGSNWEDFLAALPPSQSSNSSSVQTQLQWEDGTIHIHDSTGDEDALTHVRAWLDVPAGFAKPLTFALRGSSPAEAGLSAGQLQLQGSWSPAGPPAPGESSGTIQLTLETLPIHWSRYAAQRFGQSQYATGSASGQLQLQLRPAGAWMVDTLQGHLEFAPLQIVMANAAHETLQLPEASLKIDANAVGDRFEIQQCELVCPIGSLAIAGSLRPMSWEANAVGLRRAIERQTVQVSGQIDLAALGRQIPRALHLRDDVQLTSGLIGWNMTNQPDASGTARLTGHIESSGLAAQCGTEAIRLDESMQLRFRVGADQEGPFAEELMVQAPFLSLEARGRLQQGQLTLESDLSRLTQEIGQFFELGTRRLAGRVHGLAKWESASDHTWQVDGDLRAEGLQVVGLSTDPWFDDQLRLEFSGRGRFESWQLAALDTFAVQCHAGTDELRAQLSSPVVRPSPAAEYPLTLNIAGDLTRWRSRVAWALPQPLPQIGGQVQMQASVRTRWGRIALDPVHIALHQLELVTADRTITEPTLELTAHGVYDWQAGLLACDAATLASTTISLQAESVRWQLTPATRVEGVVQFRGDLENLWRRIGSTATARPRGQWTGRAQLSATSTGTSVRSASQIDDFQWQQRTTAMIQNPPATYQTVWQEPKVQFDVDAFWPIDGRDLQIANLRCQSDTLVVKLVGSVSPFSGSMLADLQGDSNLNLDALSLRLRPWLGSNVQLSGAVEKPFRLRGPLQTSDSPGGPSLQLTGTQTPAPSRWPAPELEGEFGLGWQGVNAFGFVGGAGSLDARLQQQTLRLVPFPIAVGQGRLMLAPQIELFAPYRVSLDKGPVIEQVTITPEMCHRWLKYLAPLVADATAAEGLFSIRVAGAEMPLSAPYQAEAGGSMTIHQAHIGPGPLARELLTVAQTIRTLVDPQRGGSPALEVNARWIDLPEQVIPFRVAGGQVVHQNLTMQIGDVTIRTRGQVGFDQTLRLVAEIPVQDRWIAQQPYLAGLRGQTLKVPIRGTLQRPSLDARVLQSLTRQSLRGAAEGFLQQELQRQLKDLLPVK